MREVEAIGSAYRDGNATLDRWLDAQRRRSDAEAAYYRSSVDYTLAVYTLQRLQGSLLGSFQIHLADEWVNPSENE